LKGFIAIISDPKSVDSDIKKGRFDFCGLYCASLDGKFNLSLSLSLSLSPSLSLSLRLLHTNSRETLAKERDSLRAPASESALAVGPCAQRETIFEALPRGRARIRKP